MCQSLKWLSLCQTITLSVCTDVRRTRMIHWTKWLMLFVQKSMECFFRVMMYDVHWAPWNVNDRRDHRDPLLTSSEKPRWRPRGIFFPWFHGDLVTELTLKYINLLISILLLPFITQAAITMLPILDHSQEWCFAYSFFHFCTASRRTPQMWTQFNSLWLC